MFQRWTKKINLVPRFIGWFAVAAAAASPALPLPLHSSVHLWPKQGTKGRGKTTECDAEGGDQKRDRRIRRTTTGRMTDLLPAHTHTRSFGVYSAILETKKRSTSILFLLVGQNGW